MTTSAAVEPGASRSWKSWLPLILFSILWLDLIRLLSTQWEAREQYAYGWFVPIFAAALFWRRWQDRPGSESSQWSVVSGQSSVVGGPWSVVRGPHFLLSAFCFLLLFSLLPLRIIYEINTDWPLIAWLYTGIIVFVSLYAVYLADPSRTHFPSPKSHSPSSGSVVSSQWSLVRGPWSVVPPWVAHFAFPICFILVAVVWPYRIEKGLTQGLMQVVASLTVEILGWFDIPAMQHGNLIELSTGTVGVDEACSGIRSFQSSLMAGLLMGELYRMRIHWRAVLVLSGLVVGFGLNVVRTLLLSWQASREGLGAIDKWHDPAGMTITVLCFFCLWGLAILLRRWTTPASRPRVPESQGPNVPQPSPISHLPSTASEVSGQWSMVNGQGISNPWSAVRGQTPFQLSAFNFLLLCGAWSLLCIAATETWYRAHANPNSGKFYWSASLPEANPTFEKVELPPHSIKLLSFDQGAMGKWRADGAEWSAYFFRWKPRSIESVIYSRLHRPDVCLPAAGLQQVSESEPVVFEAQGLNIPFRKYVFRSASQTLYVFFAQWEDGSQLQAGMSASKQQDRLHSVLSGRRLVGQQTFELILSGYSSLEEAEKAVRRDLPGIVRPEE